MPLDAPEYVAQFLDHWQPDLAVFTESEIWPNLIIESSNRGIPLMLVNARMTKRSFRRWRRNQAMASQLFGRFALVLAQNDGLARRRRRGRIGDGDVLRRHRVTTRLLRIDQKLDTDAGKRCAIDLLRYVDRRSLTGDGVANLKVRQLRRPGSGPRRGKR